MSEERKHHYFSPSTLLRRELCPASYKVESSLSNELLPPSPYAERGTRIHDYVAYKIDMAYSTEDAGTFTEPADIAEDEIEIGDKILNFFAAEYEDRGFADKDINIYIERKTAYTDWNGDELYTGYYDLFVWDKANKRGYLYDWKTGYKPVEGADNNPQGAAYALAVAQQFRLDSVSVCFYNPAINQETRNTFENFGTIADYIENVIGICEDSGAPHNPGGKQCKYCKGALLGACPAYLAQSSALATTAKEGVLVPLCNISDNAISELFAKCKAVEALKEQVEKELKRRIEDKGECGGWVIKCSRAGREVKDIAQLWLFARDEMTDAEIISCANLSIPKLEKAFAKKAKENGKFATEKEATEYFKRETVEFLTDKEPKKCLTYNGAE